MRWEDLFDDLAAAYEEEERAQREAELADLARAERAVLDLARRLRGHLGAQLTLELVQGSRFGGVLRDVGSGWAALDLAGVGIAGAVIVNLKTCTAIRGLSAAAGESTVPLHRMLGLSVVVRRLAVNRTAVRLQLVGGNHLTGTLDRVGSDHLDLAEHAMDEVRRHRAVREVVAIPLDGIATIETGLG